VRSPRLGWLAASVCGVVSAPAASFDDRVEALFRPLLAEKVALSPDGQRIAYTSPGRDELSLVIVNIDPPGPRRTVRLEAERDPATLLPREPMRLRTLRWATDTRLFIRSEPLPPIADATGRVIPNPDGPKIISPILAVNADGKQHGTLVDAPQFQETPADARKTLADLLRTTRELQAVRNEPLRWRMPQLEVLGFLPRDREQLVLQTRGAYSMPTLHLVDIYTGVVREFGNDWPPPPKESQIFDPFRLKVVGERKAGANPHTVWHDEELARVQRELEKKFTRRTVEILEWSETRARVLLRVTGGSDPGRIFVYQRTEDLVLEAVPHAPWLSGGKLHETRAFDFAAHDGAALTGYVTWPTRPRLSPPPLVLIFAEDRSGPQAAFDPEAEVFAELGFAVVRLNPRVPASATTPGTPAADPAAAERAIVADACVVLHELATRHPARPFDRKRIAVLGHGTAAQLAVRALQLEPTVFRAGVVLGPASGTAEPMRPLPPARNNAVASASFQSRFAPSSGAPSPARNEADAHGLSAPLSQPVLVLSSGTGNGHGLRHELQRLGSPHEHAELESGFSSAEPKARARTYRQIEHFLDQHLQDYAVTIGPTREVQ
jgi:hypothetical protein